MMRNGSMLKRKNVLGAVSRPRSIPRCNNANRATRMKRTDEQSFPFVWPDPALVLKTVVQAAVEQAKVDHLQI